MRRYRHVFGVGDDAGFDVDRFVITNAYTGGSDNLKKSFAEAPKHRQVHYNEMCRQQLDYERGDDFLQIGQIELGTARRYLLRQVPRQSLLAVGGRFAFAFFSSLILPLLHWFVPSQAMGEIRPWKRS